jgi:hypothetical protein
MTTVVSREIRESQNTQPPRLRLHALLTEGYVSYKIQTAPSCVSVLGSPRGARHDWN